MAENREKAIKERIGVYPDFPKKGVSFKDVFSLYKQPSLADSVVDLFYENVEKDQLQIDAVLGLDARGFLFGPQLAAKLNATFVPVRKKGKLPGETVHVKYSLEYGEAQMELQKHSIKPGSNVVIIDDLLATGGTMQAACLLSRSVGVNIVKCLVVVELTGLQGRKKLDGSPVYSIVQYDF